MTADELSDCLHRIGWSARELARRVGWDERSIRRMCGGSEPIPDGLTAWVRRVANLIDHLPPPPAMGGTGAPPTPPVTDASRRAEEANPQADEARLHLPMSRRRPG
jgi:hypothetical protein